MKKAFIYHRMENDHDFHYGQEHQSAKANLYLAGIIVTFIILTFIAYLLNEGRHHVVIPILRKYYPTCKWVLQHDKIENDNEGKQYLEVDLACHAMHFGVKKAQSRTSSYSALPNGV